MADIPDTELAELRKKAHAFDSEQGRLQKAQTDLEAERAARREAEARAAAQQQHIPASTLDSKALEVFGADGVAMLQGMLTPVMTKLNDIGKRFDERDTAEAQAVAARKFQGDLDNKLSGDNLPGFVSRLYGGDLTHAWSKFVEERPALRRAQSEGDVASVSDMVSIFIHQNKELMVGGPSPTAVTGAVSMVKSDYTEHDYERDMKAAKNKLDNLLIDEAEYDKQAAAIFTRYTDAQEKAERAVAGFGLV